MAKLIERPEEDSTEEYATLEQPEEQLEQPEQPEEVTEQEDEIPNKYQGKDVKDIVRMHQEAEKLLGRQSSEVGELRKIVDDFVKTQLNTQKQSPQAQIEEEDDLDFFYDPEAAVQKVIERHPKIKEAEEYTRQAKQASIIGKIEQKHPDFKDIVADNAFAEWVQASKVRTELYIRADQQFDFDSADELLSLWKERRQAVSNTEDLNKADRQRQARAASTGAAKGSGEAPSRKIYRRADIIELMQKDPKRYNAMSDEIMAAYAEGRVK
tara:strand:+ start:846 stop:1649 length:804 start_codon:yes stop_codon:yes gene_type:complete